MRKCWPSAFLRRLGLVEASFFHALEVLDEVENIHRENSSMAAKHKSNSISSESTFSDDSEDLASRTVSLSDFDVGRQIGSGGFGHVFLVKYKSRGPNLAMKVIRKKDIPETVSDREHVKSEHHALTHVRHPFIVKLHCAYQTRTKLFYVMEFLQGGELFTWMEKFERFTKNMAQFYLAELFLALEFLHSKGIVYRDIKPENVMLDHEGHVRLVDFGLCKVGIDDDSHLTKTMCGTHSFIAPEIVRGEPYGVASDWWAFGILAYDMFVGGPPFKGNKMEVYEQILRKTILIPRRLPGDVVELFRGLLIRNPVKRLGHASTGGPNAIRGHAFFSGVVWLDMYLKKVKPPIVPRLQSVDDLANFDNIPSADDCIDLTDEVDTADVVDDELFLDFSFVDTDF